MVALEGRKIQLFERDEVDDIYDFPIVQKSLPNTLEIESSFQYSSHFLLENLTLCIPSILNSVRFILLTSRKIGLWISIYRGAT